MSKPESVDRSCASGLLAGDPTRETREQFESRYAAGSPGVVFGQNMISMSCTCEDGGGPTHWAAIRNSPEAIRSHLEHEAVLNDLQQQEVLEVDAVTPSAEADDHSNFGLM